MGTVYIAIIMLFRIVQHLFNKRSSRLVGGITEFVSYSAFRQLASSMMGLALILVTGSGFKFDMLTVLISVFSGIMLVASMGCSLFAMQSGTVAITSMFATSGLIIPCVCGIVMFGIPMSAMQWVGIGIFLVSAYMLAMDAKTECCNFSIKTLLLLIGSFLSNGLVMLAQQMFSFYRPEGNVSMFSFLSFGIVGVIMLIASFTMNIKTQNHTRLPRRLVGYGLALSFAVFVINQLAVKAAALVPPAVLFSFINGGSTIIAAIIAFLCFGERLTVKKVAGIIVGIASLIIIKIF